MLIRDEIIQLFLLQTAFHRLATHVPQIVVSKTTSATVYVRVKLLQ